MRAPAVNAQFPAKLAPLFQPHRYKVLYGGRGGAKSWGACRALLVLGAQRPARIVCCREIQKSISDSVHQLLKNQIAELGLEEFYTVYETYIEGRNGTLFTFHGLLHNVRNIKSLEGADICWVEEAQMVSKSSWEVLVPTIRKDNSEIWITFNPELETDYTYVRYVLHPPKNAVVIKVNHSDNPWFPKTLEDERRDLQERDPDSYLTVWEGHCRQTLEGAVYADELRECTQENRILAIPYDKSKGVHVFADLGWSDCTSLWFVQRIAMQYRVLHAYQNQHKAWSHYLKYIQDRGYLIHTIWLPHDGEAGQLGTGKSIKQLTEDVGYRARTVPMLSITSGINAAREIFPEIYFDKEGTADGLTALRRYVWDRSAHGLARREPKHDENSHYADAFRYFAVAFREPANVAQSDKKLMEAVRPPVYSGEANYGTNWMR